MKPKDNVRQPFVNKGSRWETVHDLVGTTLLDTSKFVTTSVATSGMMYRIHTAMLLRRTKPSELQAKRSYRLFVLEAQDALA